MAVGFGKADYGGIYAFEVGFVLLLAKQIVGIAKHVWQNVVIAAEAHRPVRGRGAYDVAVEVGFALVGNAQLVGVFVGVDGTANTGSRATAIL